MAQPPKPNDTADSEPTAKPKRARSQKPRTTPSPEEPANAINFGGERADAKASGGALRVEAAPGTQRARRGKKAAQREEPPAVGTRSDPVPDAVRERFIQIGKNFFFPDGAEAFTDHGNRVTTRSENTIVIQSMVAIAQARSADKVTVTGTDFFRREAWFAARLAGLEVLGYTPTALEQERLVRAIARRRTAEKDDPAPGAAPPQQGERGPGESARGARETPVERGELLVGRLVDHGPAPYQHKSNQPMSYYVRIETEHGDREIWGVDLERAFRQSLSTPGIGDEVGVRSIGREPVTVIAPKYDGAGREIGRKELDTHRNQWIVERKEFLDRRFKMADLLRNASVSAADAVKQYPELEGSYLQLQVARAGIEQRIPSTQAREQFVDHLRAHLAKTIEYGQPLEPVYLKVRSPAPEKVQDRDYLPTR